MISSQPARNLCDAAPERSFDKLPRRMETGRNRPLHHARLVHLWRDAIEETRDPKEPAMQRLTLSAVLSVIGAALLFASPNTAAAQQKSPPGGAYKEVSTLVPL